MNETVISAVIGLIGIVIGAVITAFSSDLKSFLTRGGRHQSALIGQWHCKWSTTTSGDINTFTIFDTVVIRKVSGDRIEAEGFTPKAGSTKYTGRISSANVVTLTFQNIPNPNLTGVVILKFKAVRSELEGLWIQAIDDNEFSKGRTIWTRLASANNRIEHDQ